MQDEICQKKHSTSQSATLQQEGYGAVQHIANTFPANVCRCGEELYRNGRDLQGLFVRADAERHRDTVSQRADILSTNPDSGEPVLSLRVSQQWHTFRKRMPLQKGTRTLL